MKKVILFVGVLFCMLMAMPSYAQKTSKEQNEEKIQKKKIQEKSKEIKTIDRNSHSNNPATKVEERGISTPDHYYNTVKEKEIGTPDFWHNSPNNKTHIAKIPQKLTFENRAFQLKLNDNELGLYANGSSNVYAKLVPTPKEGLYRYTSSTKNGAAHFDANGNLILKYLDSDSGKMKEIKFQSN